MNGVVVTINSCNYIVYIMFGRSLLSLNCVCRRQYCTPPALDKIRRFYRQVKVVPVDGGYEVLLDERCIKTPKQLKMKFGNEALALAVAGEWNLQTEHIRRDLMKITGFCMTAQDNPLHMSESDLVDKQLNALSSDTILYIDDKRERLQKMQMKDWRAVVDWLNTRFGTNIEQVSPDVLIAAEISEECMERLRDGYFKDLCRIQLVAFDYGADALKSVILMIAVAGRHLTVEQAVDLSLMEQKYQAEVWGHVEYAHDHEHLELCSRVSASAFVLTALQKSS